MSSAIYMAKRAAALVNPITALSTFVQADNSAKAAAVYVPDQWQETGTAGSFRFNLSAWGRVTSGTSGNVTFAIKFGTSVTDGSNTALISPSAGSFTASGNWLINAVMLWDSGSKLLNGSYSGWVSTAGTAVTQTSITQLAAKDFTANGLGFTVSAFFGTTNASNIVYLDAFILQEVF